MHKTYLLNSIALLYVLALSGCAHTLGKSADAEADRAIRSQEVKVLVAQATPPNLATAALLSFMGDPDAPQALKLIEWAETLAPQQPELVWVQLAICRQFECDAKAQIESHLKWLDPENGLVWISDLERAQSLASDAAVTDAILRIGAASRMTFYWNQLEVMVVDALAVAGPSESLAARGVAAIGLLAAQVIPPLQPMSKACRLDQLDLPGRRAACEAMVARMERSSAVITQSLALSMQERWWTAESPERGVVRAKRRRLDYLIAASSPIQWWRMDRDMAVRIEAARRTEREEDVELAMVQSFGLPAEPPTEWKDNLHPG